MQHTSSAKQGYREEITCYIAYASSGIFFHAYFSDVVISDFAYSVVGVTCIAYFSTGVITKLILVGSSIFKTSMAKAIKWT